MLPEEKLSQPRIARALRHFTLQGALWSVYGPNATVAGAIFSGYALHIGLSEAQIAFLVSLASLSGASQLVSFYVTRSIGRKRLFMIALGHCEITAASCAVLMSLVSADYRFLGVAVLLVSAYLMGNTVSPVYSSWMSNVVPEEVRATYIGRRMFILTLTSMVYLYAASAWLDRVEGFVGFAVVFATGWLAGLAGYWIMAFTPMPRLDSPPAVGFTSSLLEPLRDRRFLVLALFLCAWNIAMNVAGAFYGIYMLKYLGLSYSRIAIYTNITLFCMILGYLAFGALAQRFGSKPILQILLVPAMVGPFLWLFTTEATCAVTVPIASFLGGLAVSGLSVALSSLLYKIVPSGIGNTSYFAAWTGLSAVAAGLGPFAGGALRTYLPAEMDLLGMQMSSLQVIFGISGCLYLLPLALAPLVQEPDATSPRYLLGQFRGNLLSYAYNFAAYQFARGDEGRARAMRQLGRSGTPLAVRPLLRGLGHMSKEVRTQAARGLGDGHFAEAVTSLVETLNDSESDIRPEAAEALGKIGDSAVAQRLVEALADDDPRVRTSAALALGALPAHEAAEALLGALKGPFDRQLFPTIADAATRRPDLRVVEPIMRYLPRLSQPVVRMQVINGVCRVLGEKNHFYRLATAEPLQRAEMAEPMMRRIARLLGRAESFDDGMRQQVKGLAKMAARALDSDENGQFAAESRIVAESTLATETARPVARHAALAIIMYLQEAPQDLLPTEGLVFLIIALTALARSMAGRHSHDQMG